MTYQGRVLLIEDDVFLRRARTTILKEGGLDVITAASLEEGLQLSKTPPLADVIIIDLLSSIEESRLLQPDDAAADVPVLLLSGHGDAGAPRRRATVTRHVESHVSVAQLIEYVEHLVEPVDLNQLREFSDGTGEGLGELAQLFLADCDDKIPELADAVRRRAALDIEALAHRVRGSASACGATRLAQMLLEMESLARDTDADAATEIMPSVQREYRAIATFISASLPLTDNR